MSEPIIMKTCRNCKQIKPISDFYKAPTNRDGYNNQCKMCHLEFGHKYQKTGKGKKEHNQANRRYGKTQKNKLCQKRYRQTAKGKQVQKRYCIANPEKRKASQVVMIAIRNNTLPHPDSKQCSCCPEQAKEYHHHKGYAKKHWLDVVPVCIPCHKKLHFNP